VSRYMIVIEHPGTAWGAYAPGRPGVYFADSNQEEVERFAAEAVWEHVRMLWEIGAPVRGGHEAKSSPRVTVY